MNNRAKVVIGKLGAPYGVKGWAKLYSFTSPSDNILSYPDIHFINGGPKIQKIRPHNGKFIVKLENIDDRDQVGQFVNAEVAVDRNHLPEVGDDNFYWHDLIGLKVTTVTGDNLGLIVEFIETGANDVMIIKDPDTNQETLIPFAIQQYVKSVNKEHNQVVVAWELDR